MSFYSIDIAEVHTTLISQVVLEGVVERFAEASSIPLLVFTSNKEPI